MIRAGDVVSDLSLRHEDGSAFTAADLDGHRTVLVLYPFAFSEVCTNQLSALDALSDRLDALGATVYGVSCDASPSQTAFREHLGVEIAQLSDFEPKGETCRALGVLHEAGMPQRAFVLIGPDRVVQWSWMGEHPGVLPDPQLVLDALGAV